MSKLDTQKEKSQIGNIIRITIAITFILLLCAGLMNSSNEVKENVSKVNVEPIVSLTDLTNESFNIIESELNDLVYDFHSIGKSYHLELTRGKSYIKMKIYQIDDQELFDSMFENVVEETYTSMKKDINQCTDDCYMPKVKYDVVINSMLNGNERWWNADAFYDYMDGEHYNRHRIMFVKCDDKILSLEIAMSDLSIPTPFINRLAKIFYQLDLNKL